MNRSASQLDAAPGGLPRILIIDDNPSIHKDFDLVLAGEMTNSELEADLQRVFGQGKTTPPGAPAYLVDHALSGLDGIDFVKRALREGNPYQLAFVDIRMPGIDGVETIERAWKLDPRLQVVICTAYADYSQLDLTQRLGFTDKLLVLKKPFDIIEVTQLALTLTEKWHLAAQAELKLEQMEWLVAQRTRRVLELRQRESSGQTEVPTETADQTASKRELPLVLVVEETPEECRRLRQALAEEYQVVEAKDGEEGFTVARETVPDVILASLTLPKGDGFEFCRSLKADELASHIPVVLISREDSAALRLKALEAGADDFIAPPAEMPSLRGRLNHLLRSRRPKPPAMAPDLLPHPRELGANQMDVQFLRRTIDTAERHLADFEFDVEALSKKMFMSRRQFFRKLKAVADCAPNVFIRKLRLKRAAQLLRESQMTVTEITYAVGFSDLKHFRTVFREHFGMLPGEYAGRAGQDPG